MSSDAAFDYRRLSIAERLQLVEDIWDSIAADADAAALPLAENEKTLLDERLEDLESHPGGGAPWPGTSPDYGVEAGAPSECDRSPGGCGEGL
jgi:putative addiction module component (TIGR02574 family)